MTVTALTAQRSQNSSTQLSNAVTATAPATIDRALAALEERTFQLSPGVYRFHQGKGPTERERSYAERSIAAIDERMNAGLDIAEAHRLVRALFANMRQGRDGFDADSLLDGMDLALDGRSGAAFREAVRRILAGEAGEGISKTFAPSTAELVTETKRVEAAWTLQRQRLVRFLDMAEAADTRIDENAPLTAAETEMLTKMRAALPAVPRALPPAKIVPTDRTRGPSPAAKVAQELAARRAAREAV